MSKSQKLRAAFDYMSSRSNLTYVTWRSFQAYKGWEYDYAIEIYDRRGETAIILPVDLPCWQRSLGMSLMWCAGVSVGSRDGAADG